MRLSSPGAPLLPPPFTTITTTFTACRYPIVPSIRSLPLPSHHHNAFSTTTSLRLKPRKAPSTLAAERARKAAALPPSNHRSRSVPGGSPTAFQHGGNYPYKLLGDAYREGILAVNADKAVRILEEFVEVRRRGGNGEGVKDLLEAHAVSANTLTTLGQTIRSTHAQLARELFLAASQAKDEKATVLLLSGAIKRSQTRQPQMQPVRAHLDEVICETKSPLALLLKGQLYEAEGLEEQALEMYERAADMDRAGSRHGSSTKDVITPKAQAQACIMIARLKHKRNDAAGEKMALERAALEHDDALGYYNLAANHHTMGTGEWRKYMTKAAASGIPEAAFFVGQYYMRRFRERELSAEASDEMSGKPGMWETLQMAFRFPDVGNKDLRDLATEWFSVAVESPEHQLVAESQLHLGLMLRERGEYEEGRVLLEKSGKSARLAAYAVPFFRRVWGEKEKALRDWDVDEIISGKADMFGRRVGQ